MLEKAEPDYSLPDEAIQLIQTRQAAMRALKDKFKALVDTYNREEDRKFPRLATAFFTACSQYFEATDNTHIGTQRNYDSWYSEMMGDDFAKQRASADYLESASTLKEFLQLGGKKLPHLMVMSGLTCSDNQETQLMAELFSHNRLMWKMGLAVMIFGRRAGVCLLAKPPTCWQAMTDYPALRVWTIRLAAVAGTSCGALALQFLQARPDRREIIGGARSGHGSSPYTGDLCRRQLRRLWLTGQASAAAVAVEQSTTGQCSPIQSGNNNVFICNGVDPRAMKRLNDDLDRMDLSLQQKASEAHEWARKYNELSARFEENKKQLEAGARTDSGRDSTRSAAPRQTGRSAQNL